VPLLPRDLTRPYASQAEKAADWKRVFDSSSTLRELLALADVPQEQWPDDAVVHRLRAVPPIEGETAGQRLKRWRGVFGAEISALDQAVTSAVRAGGHGAVPDIDLRSAAYLSNRLLATLYGDNEE
jgi:hypothetical protein